MPIDTDYDQPEATRDEVNGWPGLTVLEFGQGWCPHCQGAQPAIREVLGDQPDVRHRKVGDGKGKPLGRSFQVKLWPTLVFVKGGQEVARVVRPTSASEIRPALEAALAAA
jgi:thioredoxin 1